MIYRPELFPLFDKSSMESQGTENRGAFLTLESNDVRRQEISDEIIDELSNVSTLLQNFSANQILQQAYEHEVDLTTEVSSLTPHGIGTYDYLASLDFKSAKYDEQLELISNGMYRKCIIHDFNGKRFKSAAETLEIVIKYATEKWDEKRIITNPLSVLAKLFGTLIECYVKLEQWSSATSSCREFVRRFPELQTPYCSLAYCLLKLKRYEEAVSICSAAIKTFPRSDMLYSLRGKASYEMGKFKQAAVIFINLLKLLASTLLHQLGWRLTQ